jgi:YYY domain-containing protein
VLAMLTWWLIAQVFGLAALPLTTWVFRWLPDRGYAFSKIVGLLMVSYLLWLGASMGVLVNDSGGILLALGITAALSTLLSKVRISTAFHRLRAFWHSHRRQILVTELLFLVTFAGWSVVRAYAPDKIQPAGGEKYMEIAFLNGVLNSAAFPPLDPWLSGFSISYYYFGYVMMAVMTRLSAVAPAVGFDLYDALIFALSALGGYGVASSMVAASGGHPRAASAYGVLGSLLVVGMGNLQGLIHALYSARILPQNVIAWLAIPSLATDPQSGSLYPGHGWWWWRASRIFNDLDLNYQPVPFQPINEFPFFSFLLGDNHPHKMALPFVILAIGLAFNLMLRMFSSHSEHSKEAHEQISKRRFSIFSAARQLPAGLWLFYALSLGGLAFLNTWDFPIYLGLIVLTWLVGRNAGRLRWSQLPGALAVGAALGVLSLLLYLFFYLGFSSQAGGILPYVFPPTRLIQYLVMFGPFVFIMSIFSISAVRRSAVGRFPWRAAFHAWAWIFITSYGAWLVALLLGMVVVSGMAEQGQLPGFIEANLIEQGSVPATLWAILQARFASPWLFLLLSGILACTTTAVLQNSATPTAENQEDESSPAARLAPAAIFALLLIFTGTALTLSVEFFYLRDSFGLRMNTIFKFFFQGWVMMACASPYAAWWLSQHIHGWQRPSVQWGFSLLVAAGMVYPLMATYSRVEGFRYDPTLDASATLDRSWPDDWAIIHWLQENEMGQGDNVPIILEAPGESYRHTSRVSAFTGFPTLLGWEGHQWQWRGDGTEQDRRKPVIRTIYTTSSTATALDLLHMWSIDYVMLGEAEIRYIERVCRSQEFSCNPRRAIDKFNQFLIPVVQQGGATLYRVPQPGH